MRAKISTRLVKYIKSFGNPLRLRTRTLEAGFPSAGLFLVLPCCSSKGEAEVLLEFPYFYLC